MANKPTLADALLSHTHDVWPVQSGQLLSDVLDEELRVAETLLIDDELAEYESGVSVAVRANDRVERGSSVGVAC